jgi:hypothetical protein
VAGSPSRPAASSASGRTRAVAPPSRPGPAGGPVEEPELARLQALAGNRAAGALVSGDAAARAGGVPAFPVVARQAAGAGRATQAPPTSAPPAQAPPAQAPPAQTPQAREDELVERVARAIGVYETNRGGDAPVARESSLETVAGVRASVRSVGQQIVSRAVEALLAHPQLRELATPPLTRAELLRARETIGAVTRLLRAVEAAAARGQEADDVARDHADLLDRTGLDAGHVATMLSAVGLRARLRAASEEIPRTLEEETPAIREALVAAEPRLSGARLERRVRAEVERRRKALIAEHAAAVPRAQRLGLGLGSLRAYIRNPRNWGENAAAWQRLAVERMPDGVGTRIVQAAEHDGGLPMTAEDVRAQVRRELAREGVTDEDVLLSVARRHNRDPAYPAGVLAEYRRLYPAPASAP